MFVNILFFKQKFVSFSHPDICFTLRGSHEISDFVMRVPQTLSMKSTALHCHLINQVASKVARGKTTCISGPESVCGTLL